MPIEPKPEKQPAPRTCKRCGQPIHTLTDSWEMQTSADGKYATGIQHVTCPASPELQDLPSASPSGSPELGRGGLTPTPVYLTMDEAAKLLRVSKDTIRNRIRAGVLPALRLKGGQTVLIDQRDVLALLEPINPKDMPL